MRQDGVQILYHPKSMRQPTNFGKFDHTCIRHACFESDVGGCTTLPRSVKALRRQGEHLISSAMAMSFPRK